MYTAAHTVIENTWFHNGRLPRSGRRRLRHLRSRFQGGFHNGHRLGTRLPRQHPIPARCLARSDQLRAAQRGASDPPLGVDALIA